MDAFRLSKWYLDVVDERGRAFIGYAATLRWGRLSMTYASAITASPRTKPVIRTTLRARALPVEDAGEIRWRCEDLGRGVQGVWRALDEPTACTLYACPDGAVEWDCLMPRASARVELEGAVLVGLGYAERLDLSLRPWKLPIRELRWGRALTDDEGIVWVDWRGDAERPHEIQVVQHGNARLARCALDDTGIVLEGARLVQLDAGTSLRTGALGTNVLPSLPPSVTRRLPGFFMRLHERKTLCRASLGGKGAWCVHEVVTFP